MNKNKRLLPILMGIILSCSVLCLFMFNWHIIRDIYWINRRNTEEDLAYAFGTALRLNHPEAYEMVDPVLKTRVDQWLTNG